MKKRRRDPLATLVRELAKEGCRPVATRRGLGAQLKASRALNLLAARQLARWGKHMDEAREQMDMPLAG